MQIQKILFFMPKKGISQNSFNQNFQRISFGMTTDVFKQEPTISSAEEKYRNALRVVKTLSKKEIQNLYEETQNKLDGIQYGLKTFEGLEFKEIYFLLSTFEDLDVPLYRDCAGRCAACFVNGRPKDSLVPNQLERMDFEDYKNLTQDIKELNKRLNFNCREKGLNNGFKNKRFFSKTALTSLFYDSDSKDTWIKDKNGVVHEIPELNKMLFEATGMPGLIDTAGWSPQNTKVQERMERIADYYSKPDNQNELLQLNISLNTYNGLMKKANDFKAKGDIEGYNRMRYHYVKNIANAMYTMTPLLDTDIYHVLVKCVSGLESDEFEDYKEYVCNQLRKEVLDILRDRYLEDFHEGKTKFVKSYHDINKLVDKQRKAMSENIKDLSPNPEDELFSKISNCDDDLIKYKEFATYNEVVERIERILIDMNGKVYGNNDDEIFETNIQLNFKNKNKKTKQIYPIPDKRILDIKMEKYS